MRSHDLEPQMPADALPRMLTTKEAAKFLRVSISFLMKARLRGDGPRYRKLGRAVRYTETDLLSYLKASARTSTAEA
jgi:hypothetical protein